MVLHRHESRASGRQARAAVLSALPSADQRPGRGPSRTAPSGPNREPCSGQSQSCSASFQCSRPPRWVQTPTTSHDRSCRTTPPPSPPREANLDVDGGQVRHRSRTDRPPTHRLGPGRLSPEDLARDRPSGGDAVGHPPLVEAGGDVDAARPRGSRPTKGMPSCGRVVLRRPLVGLDRAGEVRRGPVAQPVDVLQLRAGATDRVPAAADQQPRPAVGRARPGPTGSRSRRRGTSLRRRRASRRRARRSAPARPWRSTGRGRGSATPVASTTCSARRVVPSSSCDLGRTDQGDARHAATLVQGAAVLAQLAAERRRTSIGSNCAWSSRTVAPWAGNGTSSASCQLTSRPRDAAASCSSRARRDLATRRPRR